MQGVPQVVAELADWLREQGAESRTVCYDRADNRVTDFTRPRCPVAVRIIADKGQWVVEVGRQDWEEFFDVEVWDAYFSGRRTPGADRPLAEQAAWVTSERLQLVEDCDDLEELNRIRTTRMQTRLEPRKQPS